MNWCSVARHYRPSHSARSASIRSTRIARRAGMTLATTATSTSATDVTVNVTGSADRMPCCSAERARNHEGSAMPTTTPADVSFKASVNTRRKLATGGAERHAHAEFSRPLRDGIGHDAVDPDRRQRQRHEREGGGQRHHEPRLIDRIADDVGERLDVRDRHVAVHRRDGLSQRRGERRRVAADLRTTTMLVPSAANRERRLHTRGRLERAADLHVRHHADDGESRQLRREAQAFADGISFGKASSRTSRSRRLMVPPLVPRSRGRRRAVCPSDRSNRRSPRGATSPASPTAIGRPGVPRS